MWSKEKTDTGNDLVWNGAEQGIGVSPLKGNGNMQNVNIATDTGEVMASFARFKESQTAITNGTLTASVSDGSTLLDAPSTLLAGQWITVSASTITSVTSTCTYLVVGGGGGGGGASASEASGGGGGGGVVTSTKNFAVGAHPVVVGSGGAGGEEAKGANGGESYIDTLTPFDFWSVVVGGGGGGGTPGGNQGGGGGGAGGYLEDTTTPMVSGSYNIVVGAGGAATTVGSLSSIVKTDGTSIASAAGGGAGGIDNSSGGVGGSGGGGGGGTTGTPLGGLGTVGQGHDGGKGFGSGTPANAAGGGGGGATAVGANASSGIPGAGGAGTASSISGSSITRAVGGTGNTGNSGTPGAAGTANRGNGGGGGGGNGPVAGGAGGSGVVIIRFATASITVLDSTGAVSTTSGSDTILTWTSSGSFIFKVVGEIVAIGGGGGGMDTTAGQPGGSGGGGGSGTGTTAGQSASGQGNDGGAGDEGGGSNEAGGGGGGAGGVGSAGSTNGGNGGNGTSSSISGASVTYGGGGGGGAMNGTSGTGGTGGGGTGGTSSSRFGTNGLGGGGGGNEGADAMPGDGAIGGSGVVIISYVTGSMTATGGAITFSGGNTIHTFQSNGTFTVNSIAAAGQYFVSYKNNSNKIKLSAIFDPYGLYPIVHGTSGTATFSTLATPALCFAKATEPYSTGTANYYRYYLLDNNSRTWVYDSQVFATTLAANGIGEAWMLPDPTGYSSYVFSGMTILNGWLVQANNNQLYGKPTVDLGASFQALEQDGLALRLINPFPTHLNPLYVGKQGFMFYGDGNTVGELFPTNQFATSLPNTQSYSSFTGSGTTGTLTAVISGSSPYLLDATATIARVPVVFFPTQTTGMPGGLSQEVVYYIQMSRTVPRQFEVYATSSGGSPLTITTVGTCYFNTFYPVGEQDNTAGDDIVLFQFSQQDLTLPAYERVQCMVEIGNTLLVGGRTNTVYPWNQVNPFVQDIIALPESDVVLMVNVNNMAYVFAGNKGNVYITNNSSASLVFKLPDYCAGVPGTPFSYIEPYFTWYDAVFLRGRVYFSILDQTSTKAGNCGGVWSFIPPQNYSVNQDAGISLRLENQNSYGTYNGAATQLIANEEQKAIAPQYWAAWFSTFPISGGTTYGIDQTDDIPVTTYVQETDLAPVGTFLNKFTVAQVEFKLTTPMTSGDSIALYWRVNITDDWTALTNQVIETANPIAGYYESNFQTSQWVQIRAVVTTNGTTASSFVRLAELRIR